MEKIPKMNWLLYPVHVLPRILKHALASFEKALDGGYKSLAMILISTIVFWHIYTPIHELLHVAGAIITGGSVSELALKPQYGGTLLQPIFPFITPESDYGGQLTGFEVPNDLAYFVVDMLPYVLSLFGVALIEKVRRGGAAWIFGPAMVLAFVPFMSIPGDYYEAASLITTNIGELIHSDEARRYLVSDDVLKQIGTFAEEGKLNAVNLMLIIAGILGGIKLVLITLALQWKIAQKIYGDLGENETSAPQEQPAG